MLVEYLATVAHLMVLTLGKTTPIWLACLGGLMSELSGVINFALEGMMLMGAFGAVAATFWSGSPWVGLAGGALGGLLVGVLHGFVTLKMRANQIVSSIALNLMAAGVSGTLLNQVFEVYGTTPSVAKLPGLGHWMSRLGWMDPGGNWTFLAGVSVFVPLALLVGMAFLVVFSRGVPGLRIRACGENPAAAEAAGLSVGWIRFGSVVTGGALAGLGGAYLSIGELSQFVEQMTQGRGYVAIAAVILGRWIPWKVLMASILFGFCEALAEWFTVTWPGLPHQLLRSVPYLACLGVLLLQTGGRKPPSALGSL